MTDETLLNWITENPSILGFPSGGVALAAYFVFPRVVKFLKKVSKFEKRLISIQSDSNKRFEGVNSKLKTNTDELFKYKGMFEKVQSDIVEELQIRDNQMGEMIASVSALKDGLRDGSMKLELKEKDFQVINNAVRAFENRNEKEHSKIENRIQTVERDLHDAEILISTITTVLDRNSKSM